MIRFSIRRLMLVTLFIAVALGICFAKPHITFLSMAMSNNDLKYDTAKRKFIVTGATKILLHFGRSSRSALVNRLDDPSRNAAAHVALTQLIDFDPGIVRGESTDDFTYLTLPFKFSDSNGLEFDYSLRPPLKKYWQNYLLKYDAQGNYTLSGILLFGELDFEQWTHENTE